MITYDVNATNINKKRKIISLTKHSINYHTNKIYLTINSISCFSKNTTISIKKVEK